MPQRTVIPSTFNEPTVMWRLRHPDGRWAHSIIAPGQDSVRAMWFVNGALRSVEDFDNWTGAIEWVAMRQHDLELWQWRSVD
jgi:hypothetical protein